MSDEGQKPDFVWSDQDGASGDGVNADSTVAEQAISDVVTQEEAPSASSLFPGPFGLMVIGTIVLALIAVGIVGWLGTTSQPTTPVPTGTPSVPTNQGYSQPDWSDAPITSMPVDFLYGLPTPDEMSLLGVWSGVAVFDFSYAVGTGDFIFTDIFRGVDIATGEVLWTYDELANGTKFIFNRGIGSVVGDGETLVFTVRQVGRFIVENNDMTYCMAGSHILVMSARTGEVSKDSFLDADCTQVDANGVTAVTESVLACVGGIIVVSQGWGMFNPTSPTSTMAYQDSDLDNPLWYTPGTVTNTTPMTLPWVESDNVVAGRWVKAASGQYVGLDDGAATEMSVEKLTSTDMKSTLYDAGIIGVTAATSFNTDIGTTNPNFVSLSGWADLDASGPSWTYESGPGSLIGEGQGIKTANSNPLAAHTEDELIVVEYTYDRDDLYGSDPVLTAAAWKAIDIRTGKVKWSSDYPWVYSDLNPGCHTAISVEDSGDGPGVQSATVNFPTGSGPNSVCAQGLSTTTTLIVHKDGKEYFLYATPTAAYLLDAETGELVASQGNMANMGWLTLFQCGLASACLLSDDAEASQVYVIDLDSPTLEYQSTGKMTFLEDSGSLASELFPTDSGLFGVALVSGIYEPDAYEFVLIGG